MFNKLKIKMTLINIGVIGSILLVLSLIIYLGSPHNELNGIDQDMFETVMGGNVKDTDFKIFHHSKHNKNFLFFKVDLKGNIIEKPLQKDIGDETIKDLINKAFVSFSYYGEIKLQDGNTYFFLKAKQHNKDEINIVFKNSKDATQGFISFFSRSVLLIVLSLILVFFGSMFMAGKALVPINKAWQKQVDFTADASHELRTPIAVIQTNIELVMGNGDETVESQKKWLENILIENARMAKLVEDLLTLSRSDVNQNNLYMENFNIDEALKETITPYEPLIKDEGKTFTTKFEACGQFYGDKSRIKQLVIILIDNAIKYTGSAGIIGVELKKTGKMLEISVSDNGEGIQKEHIDKIFNRFYRIDKSRIRNKGGSGLGLSIAKWIVEEHHGNIKVESEYGKGTKFIVQLPINVDKHR